MAALLVLDRGSAFAAESGSPERPGNLTPNQLAASAALTAREALAACGPAAAVAFAHALGRPVTLDRAVAVARQVGWTPAKGMSGPYGQVALLERLNIRATIEASIDAAKIAREVQAGRPVIIRTAGGDAGVPGHYFVAERYDPANGQFDLAQSALVLKAAGGRRWYALSQISSLGTGRPSHAIYLARSEGTATLVAASAKPLTPLASRSSAATAAPTGSLLVDADGVGARLRAAPGLTGKVVGLVADGARLSPTGATVVVNGQSWKQVTGAVVGIAWIDASLLRPA